jgi:hypothetical protein
LFSFFGDLDLLFGDFDLDLDLDLDLGLKSSGDFPKNSSRSGKLVGLGASSSNPCLDGGF